VNVAVSPDTCQLPAIFGESAGSAVCGASGDENVTVIGAAPFTPLEPPLGLTETTVSGATGAAGAFRAAVPASGLLSLALASRS
jgi:hypothetical protein